MKEQTEPESIEQSNVQDKCSSTPESVYIDSGTQLSVQHTKQSGSKITKSSGPASSFAFMLTRVRSDGRMTAMHVCLLSALFVCWQKEGTVNPFPVTRRRLMSYAKIASIATYHKCIRELDECGYIRYQPSYHPRLGSQVHWPPGWKA